MLTTLDILEMVKAGHGDCSDYRAAKLLGAAQQTVSMWIARGSVMDDKFGLKAAELLDIEPEYVLACLHAERAKDGASKEVLVRIAERFKPSAKPRKKAA